MRVLVTGGLGFVGYAVSATLVRAGHEVTVLSRPGRTAPLAAGAELVTCDVRDAEGLRKALEGREFDGICHLAGLARVRESFADPVTYFEVNLGGTLSLLRALADTQARAPAVVFASTGAVYGSGAEGRLTEDDPALPDNPYAVSKRAAEQLLEFHAATGAIGATVLRCFAIAGALDGVGDHDHTRILPAALRVAAGEAPAVQVNGDGSAVREFTHVADVAQAYRLALEAAEPGSYRLYNLGAGTGVSVREVVETVAARTGRPVPVEHRPPKPEPHTLIADSSRIRSGLGWTSPHSTLDRIIDDAWATYPTIAGAGRD